MKSLIIVFIRFVSLFFRSLGQRSCRFHPSCSVYAEQALVTHGLFTGLWLATKRIAKCHPFSSGGFDPVVARNR